MQLGGSVARRLCGLSAVDLEGGVLHVVNVVEADELTKSRKNRTLPMPPTVRDQLAALYADVPKMVEGGQHLPKSPHCFTWENGQAYTADWITRRFAALVKAAGVQHCSIHDLRRSFSTLAQRAGVNKYVVKDLGGWSEVSVVENHYTGEVPEVLDRAMKKIAAAQGVA